ncbi:MAG: hypothetical protein OXM60_24975, partial [Defluviicoccus sp.]|nr:hypothetical protein [Defluviicoccus sp.]
GNVDLCRLDMPVGISVGKCRPRARRRGVGISDPRVGMSRIPSVAGISVGGPLRVTAASVAMAIACMFVSST